MNDSFNAFIDNNNPGVEYEIALAYLLLPTNKRTTFHMSVISRHQKSALIQKVIQGLMVPFKNLTFKNIHGDNYSEVSCATQDDAVGPSDLVLSYADGSKLGLSIKYMNKCNLNITGREFLTESSIKHLQAELPLYARKFIEEMEHEHGDAQNWFRKRKQSTVTDEYIDLIRGEVISQWSNKVDSDKVRIFQRLFHNESPIPFYIVYIKGDPESQISIEVDCSPTKVVDISKVKLSKSGTSYVLFSQEGRNLGKMQVKFNNGFLERGTRRNFDLYIGGIYVAYGQPFSSWNFSII